jgi:hypothetical protein
MHQGAACCWKAVSPSVPQFLWQRLKLTGFPARALAGDKHGTESSHPHWIWPGRAVPKEADMTKYVVSYELPYDHLVEVGIEAESEAEAINKARTALDEGSIWDDTPEMPLLHDDFEESNSPGALEFRAREVEDWPAADAPVQAERERLELREKAVSMALVIDALQRKIGLLREALAEVLSRKDIGTILGRTTLEKAKVALRIGQCELEPVQIFVGVEGGIVQGASANSPVELLVLDYDVKDPEDGARPVPQANGRKTMAWIYDPGVLLDPDHVRQVFDPATEGECGMNVEEIIEARKLVEMAREEGPEKALRCAFFEGQIAALQELAREMREGDRPGDECHGWGTIAAGIIQEFLNGGREARDGRKLPCC